MNTDQLNTREKRKWQIALRRYILSGNKSSNYAPFFGIDTRKFREWIECQFDNEQNWDNFSRAWQFDHVIPVACFDFKDENDLKLCWNFINIRIGKLYSGKSSVGHMDIFAAKSYFEMLFDQTGYPYCAKMIEKIKAIENSQLKNTLSQQTFINQNKSYLEKLSALSAFDFDRLNSGIDIELIIKENDLLKRFE